MMATRIVLIDVVAASLLAASILVKAIRSRGKLTGSQANTPATTAKPQNPTSLG